ncbi:MAG: AhpC/TSA family protein [Bacteroidaceae bacterium]|nr:AhpC/TSA family protein [Bacteroidaceae bacterium]
MKRIMFFAIIATLLLAACTGTEFTIKGNSTDFIDGNKAYLVRWINGVIVRDSTVIQNNSFTFKGDAPKPHWARLTVGASKKSLDGAIDVEFIAEPGRIIIGDFDRNKTDRRTATGTPLNDRITRFLVEDKVIKDDAALSIEQIHEKRYALISACVKENAANYLGAFLYERFDRHLPKDIRLDLCDTLAAANPTLYANLREETLKEIEAEARAKEQKKSVTPGCDYKNLSGRMADGTVVQLADVVAKNKFVLLEFWATWCGPCMGQVPYLLDAYNKYKNKGFEIYAVSLDDDSNVWASTVKEKGLQWVNVLRENPEVSDKYGVSFIPSNFLIDCSNGKIVAIHLRGNELVDRLAELLK